MRSSGPETDTAATTSPRASVTGADTLDTPGSRSSMDSTQPRGPCSPCSTWPAEPRSQRQRRPHGHDGAQPVGRLEGRHAHPLVAVDDVQLHRLAGGVAQRLHGRAGTLGQRELLGRGPAQGQEVQPQGEPPVGGPAQQAVVDQGDRHAVRGGPAESRSLHQLGQGALLRGHAVQHGDGLVEDAHATYSLFHRSRTLSH